jgi:hypothetical protein
LGPAEAGGKAIVVEVGGLVFISKADKHFEVIFFRVRA